MAEQVTISIPRTLYCRARELARSRNQSVDVVLEAGVTLVEASAGPLESEVEAMRREKATWPACHPKGHPMGRSLLVSEGSQASQLDNKQPISITESNYPLTVRPP